MNCVPVRSLFGLLAFLFSLAFTGGARADLTLEQVNQAKSATAILLNGERSGTAFCVSESGLFITNHHVIANRDASALAMVIDPAGKDEKKYPVQVIRKFEKEDLAIVKVELDRKVPALKIGDDSALFETQQLIAFGYPFGQMLATKENDYPAISVNIGRVTALRRKDGVLDAIQLDAQVNPGNSGGPVLDDKGNVVGIVRSGVPGSGVNFAIPISALKRVYNTPVLTVTPPAVTFAKRFDPAEFVIAVDWLAAPAGEPAINLEITSGGVTRKIAAVKGVDQKYRASLTPLVPPIPGQKPKCQITIEFETGRVAGTIESFNLTLPGQTKPLAEVSTIKRVAAGTGFTVDDQPAGELPELIKLNVDMGGNVMTVDARAAKRIDIIPPANDPGLISYKVTLTPAGQILAAATSNGTIPLNAMPPPPAPAGSTSVAAAPLPPAPITGTVALTEKREFPLPSPFDDVVAAANGRALIFHLKDAKKLVVFDVVGLKIRGYINLASEPALFAGGSRHIIVAYPAENIIQRYSVETLEKERTINNPMGVLSSLTMGYASPNIALFVIKGSGLYNGQPKIFDTDRMAVAADGTGKGRASSINPDSVVRASADGRTYGFYRRGTSPSGFTVLTYKNNEVDVSYEHESVGLLVPNADGSVIFTSHAGAFTPKYAPVFKLSGNWSNGMTLLPSYHPMYFFGVPYSYSPSDRNEIARTISIYVGRSNDPLVNLSEVFGEMQSKERSSSSTNDPLSFDKRYHFYPQLNVMLTLPLTNDKIVTRPLNVQQVLNEKGIDYLYVTSSPATGRVSQRYQYTMTAASKAGGVTFTLQSGPEGMTISPKGEVSWTPAKAGEETVIVALKDASGQEAFNTFQVVVIP